MLLKQDVLAEIRAGRVSCVFRKWRRPTVKTGGTLQTAIGLLAIDAVEAIVPGDITARDVKDAGFASRAHLDAELMAHRDGQLYRIRLRYSGADPRIALRQDSDLSQKELSAICSKLNGMDQRSADGVWTQRTLVAIEQHPAIRAAELAEPLGLETMVFKTRVRRLKQLGLTESLETGYRLSQRGRVVLGALRSESSKSP